MFSVNMKEKKCLVCKKTIRMSKKINICNSCRKKGKNAAMGVLGLGVFITTGRALIKKND